jgi:hypothetical protein
MDRKSEAYVRSNLESSGIELPEGPGGGSAPSVETVLNGPFKDAAAFN